MKMANGGIPIGMEMESEGCIRAYKAALREEAELRRKRKRTRRNKKERKRKK